MNYGSVLAITKIATAALRKRGGKEITKPVIATSEEEAVDLFRKWAAEKGFYPLTQPLVFTHNIPGLLGVDKCRVYDVRVRGLFAKSTDELRSDIFEISEWACRTYLAEQLLRVRYTSHLCTEARECRRKLIRLASRLRQTSRSYNSSLYQVVLAVYKEAFGKHPRGDAWSLLSTMSTVDIYGTVRRTVKARQYEAELRDLGIIGADRIDPTKSTDIDACEQESELPF